MNLDTLSILLEVTGGQAVIKQIGGVEKSLDKAESAAKKADKGNKQLGQGFRDLRSGVMRVMAPLAAFAVIVNRSIDFAKQGENLLMMANSAGVAADRFTTLALAAERLGGSRQGMAAVMSSFSAGMMGLRRGEENQLTNAAMYYGVSLSGKNGLANPEEMLYNIARAMEKRSDAEKADMARMLGLDPATFQLVRQGVAGVRKELELAERYNPFKGESLDEMRKFMLHLREIKLAFGAITGELVKSSLPHMERWGKVMQDSIDYFLDHLDAVKLGIMAIGTAIMIYLGPIAVGLEALFLLLDDFITWSQGGRSTFGPIWNKLMSDPDAPMSEEEKRKRKNKFLIGTDSSTIPYFNEDGTINTAKGIIEGIESSVTNPFQFNSRAVSGLGNQYDIDFITNVYGGDPEDTKNAVAKGAGEVFVQAEIIPTQDLFTQGIEK